MVDLLSKCERKEILFYEEKISDIVGDIFYIYEDRSLHIRGRLRYDSAD